MKPKLIVIKSEQEIIDLVEYLKKFEYVAFDTETTGLSQSSSVIGMSFCAEESQAFYLILYEWDKNSNTLNSTLTNTKVMDYILWELKSKNLIMHNAVFDCIMVKNNFHIDLMDSLHTDTMVLAHLLDENRRIGLKDLAKNIFKDNSDQEQTAMKASIIANGGKITKSCYELYKADSELIGKYGAQDALLTLKLFHHLLIDLYDQGLDEFFYKDESMPLLRGPTYDLNSTGLKVDKDALTTLKKMLQAECLEDREFIYNEIKDKIESKFNINSPSQLSWLVFGQYKLEFNTLTKEGKNVCRALNLKLPYTRIHKQNFIDTCLLAVGQIYHPEVKTLTKTIKAKKVKEPWQYIMCDTKTLQKVSHKYKWIARLLEYKKKIKLLNTYVEGIEQRLEYGIIYPSFLQTGTTSGRYSSRNPNFQNLPRDDKRIKQCIVPRPGKVFVGADYSQLEPRVFACVSKDERLLKAFNGTDDFYSVIGMEVYDKYDCEPKKDGDNAFGVKYKKLRDHSKTIALASTYGANAHRLAPITGKTIEETQKDIDSYFEKFPKVAEMMLESHKYAKSLGFVKTLFGRVRRIPEATKIVSLYGDLPHADLPYEAKTLLNLSVNHRIQGTAASIVNRAAIANHINLKLANINAKLVLQVHDSLVMECDKKDAENVALILQNAMEATITLPGVRLEAVPDIGKSLAEV